MPDELRTELARVTKYANDLVRQRDEADAESARLREVLRAFIPPCDEGAYASEVSDLRDHVWGYALVGNRHVLHVLHGGSPEYITALGREPAHIEGDVCGVVQPGYEGPSTLHLFTTSMRDDSAVRLAVEAYEAAVSDALEDE